MTLPVRGALQRIPLPVPLPKRGDRIDITLHTPPRSCFVVGPASIRHGDPFGFLYYEREASHSAIVHVHPRIVRLPFAPIGSVRDPDGCVSGAVVDDDFDFHGLRPYVPGDDLRGVHWLTSARSGNLMVRRYESTVQAVPMVHFVPSISDFSDLEEFELAVSVFASIGVHCVRRHRMVFAEVHPELCPDDRSSIRPDIRPGIRPDVRSDVMSASAITPFLDLCSGITPVDVQIPQHRRNAVPHGLPRNISLHCHVVGSRHDAVALRRRCAASSEASDAVMSIIVRVERGAAASMETHGMVMLLTVGDLDGLRSLWKAVA
nr:DUF58 domain-containing protein [Bifidobacterium pongonis]